jgi:hypothetical protein
MFYFVLFQSKQHWHTHQSKIMLSKPPGDHMNVINYTSTVAGKESSFKQRHDTKRTRKYLLLILVILMVIFRNNNIEPLSSLHRSYYKGIDFSQQWAVDFRKTVYFFSSFYNVNMCSFFENFGDSLRVVCF